MDAMMMKTAPLRTLAATLCLGMTLLAGPVKAVEEPLVMAQADCYAVGQQVAAQHGGTLARASQANQGGREVCVIVVLVPGKSGERPRRTEIVVPLN
jgi:hypothetical protein